MVAGRPRSIPKARWSRLVVAVACIIERWGRQAVALGWDSLDLFGFSPHAPEKRTDQMGLCWFVTPETELVAMTAALAKFRTKTGAVHCFTRKQIRQPGIVPVWSLITKPRTRSRHCH